MEGRVVPTVKKIKKIIGITIIILFFLGMTAAICADAGIKAGLLTVAIAFAVVIVLVAAAFLVTGVW